MTTLAWLVGLAAFASALGLLARLPTGPLAILAGFLLRSSDAPLDLTLVQDGLRLSVTFLVFALGAEIDIRHVGRHLRASAGITLAQFALMAGLATIATLYAEVPFETSAHLVLAIGASSSLVVLAALRRKERFFEPTGRLVIGVVLLQDLAVVLGLAILGWPAMPAMQAGRAVLGLVGLMLAAAAIARWVAPRFLVRKDLDEEERLLFMLSVLFAFVGLAAWVDLPLVTGAFFAGLSMSRFPVGGIIRGHVQSFSDFFTLTFYVALGTMIAVPRGTLSFHEAAFVLAFLLVRPIVLFPLVRRTGLHVRAALESVALLSQTGELALIVAIVGMERGALDEGALAVIVGAVVLTLTFVPLLSSDRTTFWLLRLFPGRRSAMPSSARPQVLLIGCGEGGKATLRKLQEQHVSVLVIDDDPSVVDALTQAEVPALRGDALDPSVLGQAGAERARVVISTLPRIEDNERLGIQLHGRPLFVRVFAEEHAERLRARGARPVIEAELAEKVFLEWYEKSREPQPIG